MAKGLIGFKNTMRQLDKLKKRIPNKGLLPGAIDGGNIVESRAEALAPSDTGTLRNSIESKAVTYPNGSGPSKYFAYAVIIGVERGHSKPGTGGASKPEVYGRIIEFGSVNTPARSFLRRSLRDNRRKVINKMKVAVKKESKKKVSGSMRAI